MVTSRSIQRICLIVEPPHWTRRSLGEPWLFDVIREYSEVEFSLIVIGEGKIEEVRQTEFPDNVKSLQVSHLRTGHLEGKSARKIKQKRLSHLVQRVASIVESPSIGVDTMRDAFVEMAKVAPDVPFEVIWRDPVVWELITTACEIHRVKIPFTDFYEIVESVVRPIWNLLTISSKAPEAEIYHGVGGGYAGLLSVVLAEKMGSRSIFTDNRRAPSRQLFHKLRREWAEHVDLRPRLKQLMDHEQLWFDKTYSFVCHFADQVVSSSLPAARLIAQRTGAKKSVLRIGIGSDEENARRVRLRRRAFRGNDFSIAGIFERSSRSDVEMFFSAINSVDRQFEGCRFLLWGDWGEDELERLQSVIAVQAPIADVIFHHISTIEDEIGQIDIAVIPGQAEVGDQLLGLMFNAQIPVIATEVDKFSGLLESLDSSRISEFLVEVGAGDASEMEEALLNFLSDHRSYESAGQAARRHLNRNFTHSEMLADYGRVYGIKV